VFFSRLGEMRDRSFENQQHRASDINLVVAAITPWNTVYFEHSDAVLGKSRAVDSALPQRVSPLGWEHINLTGGYSRHTNKRIAKGGFIPLRNPAIKACQSSNCNLQSTQQICETKSAKSKRTPVNPPSAAHLPSGRSIR
jgi:hypothetical protein